ncbi:MAG: T9SS outer membrane translocon Sov/SprA [Chitinophagaceae bacterium]
MGSKINFIRLSVFGLGSLLLFQAAARDYVPSSGVKYFTFHIAPAASFAAKYKNNRKYIPKKTAPGFTDLGLRQAVRNWTYGEGFILDSLPSDSLIFPLQDQYTSPLQQKDRSSIDLYDPSNIQKTVIYDPVTKKYRIQEKMGDLDYRPPTDLDSSQYFNWNARQEENNYWMKRGNTMSWLNRPTLGPRLYHGSHLFNRTFGGTTADIRPQGSLDLTFGYQGQNYDNLTLPERARKTGGFNFNMNINMNVEGKIGSKLKITSTYNTQSVFDFEKQIKLEYTGGTDDIIKKIEAGNVSFPLRSSLITGVQSLFGIKTQLQFGRLTVTSVLSNQKSQQQNLMIQGGAQTQNFALTADQYESNQHFLLAQYFHDQYDHAVSTLPLIQSQVIIKRLEVWVTNKTGSTTNARNIVGLMDLGEPHPYNQNIHSQSSSPLPQNGANDEYENIISDPASRNTGTVVSRLNALGLQAVQDYEKTFARKLDSTEYTFNPQLGYISLNQQLQPDEVLAVAFQYTYNGRVYQVGEFSQDIPPASSQATPQVLFLKLLKATSPRPQLPIWQLMMKNIYSTGAFQINRQDFKMDVFYQDPGGGEKRYMPEGPAAGTTLLSLLNLDRLNSQNDPQPDGIFDYVEGYTINSQTGRIIFPVLEPFGSDLAKSFRGNAGLIAKYVYQVLYDSTKTVALQFPQLDRYIMRGSYKSSSSSDIFLGGFNIPPGSVTVTAGGQRLIENVDYIIDYSLGRLKILNTALLNAGIPINVQYENNAQYGQQTRSYMGTRLDYLVNDHLSLGSSIVKLSERPYFTNVNYGDDPINNTIIGIDANYRSELPGVTHWLDKLPNYSTTTMSNITATGEVAKLIPGHSPLIGKSGTIYIDDFEGASSSYDLKFPSNNWVLASTPVDATDQFGNILFPEANLMDSLDYGKNRALLAWYTIDPSLVDGGPGTPAYLTQNKDLLSDNNIRPVQQTEVFPNLSVDFGQSYINTFDLAYYPNQRGPYNLSDLPSQVDANGNLLNPQKRWGGIMRALDNTDFEASNVEYIEFWVMDPFINNPNSTGGQFYIDLGDVSEDILKDGKMSFENGLPNPANISQLDSSVWGYVPKIQQALTNAFDNNPAARAYQDVGYDGLSDVQERRFRQPYLNDLLANFGANSPIYLAALADPDNDDYHYYRGSDYDAAHLPVLARYKRFNNSEGDSPISNPNSPYSTAATNYPETEDINHDNTLNETEQYFQYRVNIQPHMQVGQNFIVSQQISRVVLPNGKQENVTWYQFKIPIEQYDAKVGDIPDFKSIRFMRMFLTGFSDSVVMRFAKLDLVRNTWRSYNYSLKTPGQYLPNANNGTNFNVSAVNIEENASRYPIPYVIPPGIVRQVQTSANNVNLQLNEQSLSLKVNNLQDGDSRGVFKSLGDMDMRRFKTLKMFIHAEAVTGPNDLKDGQARAIILLGDDFVGNYYEIQIPLQVTPWHSGSPQTIWPVANELNLSLASLTNLKLERNQLGISPTVPYTIKDGSGNYISVVGNPNLGDVKNALLGILNPKDDGLPLSTEVWFDEFRLDNMNEQGGYAAIGRMDMQLADLGTVSVSGSMHTAGFGSVDQRVNERSHDNFQEFDAATSLELGKLFPQRLGLSIPVYAGYSQSISNPQYDPYDMDILLSDKLRQAKSAYVRDSLLSQAQTFTSIKSINFTNIRKISLGRTHHHPWDIENFDLSYSFSQMLQHNPLITHDLLTKQRLGLGYHYASQPRFISPFKQLIKSSSRYLALVKDFNINLIPSEISVRLDIDRQFGETAVRNIGGGPFLIPDTYNKFFTFNRYYNFRFDPTHSISIELNAVNYSRVDEPYGQINTYLKKDSVLHNFLRLGRTTNYTQTANLNYTLPLNKFPLLDWANVRLGYSTTYDWVAASRVDPYLGNALDNSVQKQVNADLDFRKFYDKIDLFRRIQGDASARSIYVSEPGANRSKPSSSQEVSPLLKVLLKPLLSLKRVQINYSENGATQLPGYMDSTKILGNDWASMEPGLQFIFGHQPDSAWLNNFGKKGLITPDTMLNIQYQQNFTQQLSLQATLEPVNDLMVNLTLNKSFSKTHTELFKDTSSNGGFAHLSPYDAGGFNITFIALKTLFGKINSQNGISQTFLDFENDRQEISKRLGELSPYSHGQINPKDPNYFLGYGRYAQDVLVPAFLAAYTGKSPDQIGLLKQNNRTIRSDPFSNILPQPNWNITYNGLSKLGFFKSFVTNLTLTHGYVSTLSMNSYASALFFEDPLNVGFPSFIDTVSGNYIPYFLVPNITISEQLSPLIGIDVTFTNHVNFRFRYNKSRILSLSLVDYQVTEMRSNEMVLGGGFRVRGVSLPFSSGKKRTTNDMDFRIDLSFRNDKTINNRLDANIAIPTSGEEVIGISPSINYIVNNRLQLRFFYDRRQTIPVISTSYPISNTQAGVTLKFILGQ